ncbi:MAG: hypothetical protein JWQ86_3618 [Mycobacterium sp.]|nr:hypothetical protein [Mycobacterium sp.]
MATLSAASAEQFSRHGYIDFEFHDGCRARPSSSCCGDSVAVPKIGFAEIGVWLRRAAGERSDSITVTIQSHHQFVDECLFRSQHVVRDVIDAVPSRLLARPAAHASSAPTRVSLQKPAAATA